jgi:hypothetical protein
MTNKCLVAVLVGALGAALSSNAVADNTIVASAGTCHALLETGTLTTSSYCNNDLVIPSTGGPYLAYCPLQVPTGSTNTFSSARIVGSANSMKEACVRIRTWNGGGNLTWGTLSGNNSVTTWTLTPEWFDTSESVSFSCRVNNGASIYRVAYIH